MMIHHAVSYASGDFHPHYFKLPPLLSYLLFVIYGIYFILGYLFGAFDSLAAFEALFITDPTSFYLIGRFVFGVLLGTASIYLVYSLVMRVFRERPLALLSSFFLAFSFLHVVHSHYVYHDIPMIFFILLTVRKSYDLYEEPKLSHYLWAAFFGGIAAGFKYNAALLSLVIFLAHLLKEKKFSFRAVFLDKKIYLAGGAMIATYLLTNPFSVVSFSEFTRELSAQFDAEDRLPFFYHLKYSLAEGMGRPLLIVSLIGLFILLLQGGRKGVVFFSFPLIFYLFCVYVSQPHERYMLPLIPFLSISAAWLVGATRLPNRGIKSICLLGGLLILPSFVKAIYVDWMLLQKDTRAEAREWVEENIPKGASIALDHTFFLPRLSHSREQLREKSEEAKSALQKKRIDILLSQEGPGLHLFYLMGPGDSGEQFLFSRPTLPKSWRAMKEKGIQYLMIHRREEDFSDFYLNIEKYATHLKTFSPYRDLKKKYSVDPVINTAIPFLSREIYSRVRTGYTIQVYKLR